MVHGYGLLARYYIIGRPVAQAGWFGPKVGGHLAPSSIRSPEPRSEHSQWLWQHYKHCHGYPGYYLV